MQKDFETLEKIMLIMADNFYEPVEFPKYVNLLEKEFAELMAEVTGYEFENYLINQPIIKSHNSDHESLHHKRVKDELADVLVFILRISNKLDISSKELLHHAMSKMLKRASDPNYQEKKV